MNTLKTLGLLTATSLLCSCGQSDKPPHSRPSPKDWLSDNVQKNDTTKDYKIRPLDESGRDNSLKEFLDTLKAALQQKDTLALFKCLDTGIISSYGGGMTGLSDFSQTWKLNHPDKSEVWARMKRDLDLGGVWDEDEHGKNITFPSLISGRALKDLKANITYVMSAVISSSGVKVYEKPDLQSRIIATLDHDVVECDDTFNNEEFSRIETLNLKTKGYVKNSDLIRCIDYAMILRKKGGLWKVAVFAPWD